tara:strand:+ start:6459 stop:6986 length:528 start_codon:yes stop_codon:yes gene_type:complete
MSKFFKYDNFLSKNLYDKIYRISKNIKWEINPKLDGKYSNHLTYQIIDSDLKKPKLKQPYKELVDYISKRLKVKVFPHNMYFNISQHGNECAIHKDRNTQNTNITFILYLTEEWKADWHGETMLYDEEETNILFSSLPYSNTALIFDSGLKHGIGPISKFCLQDRVVLVLQLDIL